MIHEIKKLINDEGMIVLYYVPFDEESESTPHRFQGVVHMSTPEGLIPIEFFFPDEVKTPQEAFAIFKETARAHVKKMQEEAEEQASQIITPGDLV